MAVRWTADQMEVIESRGGSLLVSAAAGSGKTAVLVERIVRMITEGEKPLDIDRLLVMTFTKSAASEMKERVASAVEARLEADPENGHLQMQAALIPYAQITTIDSFCLSLVRENFQSLDIDPSFRIADEGETLLLQSDVMEKLLEERYQEGDEGFLSFVDSYASGKADGGVADLIMQAYFFSQSNPWPDKWIQACLDEAAVPSIEKGKQTPWIQVMMNDVKLLTGEMKGQIEKALEICAEDGGPQAYEPALKSDLQMLHQVEEADDCEKLRSALEKAVFARLSAARGKDIDPEKKEAVNLIRDIVKKSFTKLREAYGFGSPDESARHMAQTGPAIAELLGLTKDFSRRYQDHKREKNLVDFNDLEHFALEILYEERDGRLERSKTAEGLSLFYEELLIDEYQDSNEVQEALVRALSRDHGEAPNVFMVGDVKQSIYKFRLARPELFLEKYETYGKKGDSRRKIELRQNFRSRPQILDGVNSIFFKIMRRSLGGIDYTEGTALHPGAEFLPYPEVPGESAGCELLLVHTGEEVMGRLDEEAAEYTDRELEAKAVAARIREIVDGKTGLILWDAGQKRHRRAEYGDIAILLRSMSGWSEIFLNVLMNEGIPAYADSRAGYFTAVEVETVLSMLSVVCNPIQDIPLAAVMRSPIGEITDSELAHMAAVYKRTPVKSQDRGIYGAWRYYLDLCLDGKKRQGEERLYPGLCEKLRRLEYMVEEFRTASEYLPIHQLIYLVYEKTGYYDYVCAMPAGKTRKANLDMLVEKASSYEKTSYKGLFHFIRYIEKLKKYQSDFGEASLEGEDGGAVRIMSIHKSKGLEFPVVFLSGMGKKFNKRDTYGKILIDAKLGIAADCLDVECRLKSTTLKKNVLKRRMALESAGEELRILYVAMTRAKEKLIMTSAGRRLGMKIEKWSKGLRERGPLPFLWLSSADSYLDWVLMSLEEGGPVTVQMVRAEKLLHREIKKQAEKSLSLDLFLNFNDTATYHEEVRENLDQMTTVEYPYEEDIHLHAKMSVSELKRQGQWVDEEESDFLPTVPNFVSGRKGERTTGVFRGSAYHRALELLDFSIIKNQEEAGAELARLLRLGRIQEESYRQIDAEVIWGFLSSPLGKRMRAAGERGVLMKERQFVVGIPAREMGICGSEELVLVQGILDACFEENGTLILVDYKTDRVPVGGEEILRNRYEKQLEYYQKALEQMTGKTVSEKIIYSLSLQKEII